MILSVVPNSLLARSSDITMELLSLSTLFGSPSISLKEKLQNDLYLGKLTEHSICTIWNERKTLTKLRELSINENHLGQYFYLTELKTELL